MISPFEYNFPMLSKFPHLDCHHVFLWRSVFPENWLIESRTPSIDQDARLVGVLCIHEDTWFPIASFTKALSAFKEIEPLFGFCFACKKYHVFFCLSTSDIRTFKE